MTLLSAFGGGLFIIPLLLLGGAIFFFVRGLKASKSGSTIQNPGGTYTEGGNVPWYKTGQGKFAIGLFAAFIIVVIWMYSER